MFLFISKFRVIHRVERKMLAARDLRRHPNDELHGDMITLCSTCFVDADRLHKDIEDVIEPRTSRDVCLLILPDEGLVVVDEAVKVVLYNPAVPHSYKNFVELKIFVL